MTLTIEIFGWLCVIAGLPLAIKPGGLVVGAGGAILLGMAYAGIFS